MLPFNRLSYWEKKSRIEDINVLIIGAGIVGMTTAIYLKQQKPNQKIVIVERGYLPSGASTKNAGFACFGSPSEILDDLNQMNENKVWDTVSMRYEGLKKLFELINPSLMRYEPCGSWDLLSSLDKAITKDQIDYLNEQILKVCGEPNIYSEDKNIIQKSGLSGFTSAYFNRAEGAINTGELMEQLHAKCITLGIQFLYCTEVLTLDSHDVGFSVNTNYGTICSNQLAICTNGFASTLMDLPVVPARAQVLVTDEIEGLKIKGTFHFDRGYYYFRNIGNRLLFGGGRNTDIQGETTTDISITQNIQNHLIDRLKTNILPSESFNIAYQWAGIMGIGEDKHPIISEIKPNLFAAVRMGGMGVAIGSTVGLRLSKLMINGK